MKSSLGLSTLLVLAPLHAFADAAAGDACAAKLNADGKAIYAATMADKPTASNWQGKVETNTRSMAEANKINSGTALANASAAADCVKAALR